MPDRPCPNPRCSRQRRQDAHLLCSTCWPLVSEASRARVWREYDRGKGSRPHMDACFAAIREAREATPAPKPDDGRQLDLFDMWAVISPAGRAVSLGATAVAAWHNSLAFTPSMQKERQAAGYRCERVRLELKGGDD